MRLRESVVETSFRRRSHVLSFLSLLAGFMPVQIRAQALADARVQVLQVQQDCRQPSRLTVSIQVCNPGRSAIPRNTPVSFYTLDPRVRGAARYAAAYGLPAAVARGRCRVFRLSLRVSDARTDSFYVVVNDNGRSTPFRLPNTALRESDYNNNVALATGFRFRATVMPQTDTLERGDSVRLSITVKNGSLGRFNWSQDTGLSCKSCRTPELRILKGYMPPGLISVSREGCRDTSFSTLYIIPQADYTVAIDSIVCAGDGRGYVHFNFCDNSPNGLLPDSLPISFYQGDPANRKLIGKPFVYHPVVSLSCASDSVLFEPLFTGTITAIVHDSLLPAKYHFPSGGHFDEDELSNNSAAFDYVAPSLQIFPADTTVIRGSPVPLRFRSSLSGIVSFEWITAGRTSIDCKNCETPACRFLDTTEIRAQVRTAYGCAAEGRARLNVFPPDYTASLIESHCYKNDSLILRFSICSNNGYDSVPAKLPVSFSGRRETGGPVTQLAPIFYTATAKTGACAEYRVVIPKTADSLLWMKVNDGGNLPAAQVRLFPETNRENNSASLQIVPFWFRLTMPDTTVYRGTALNLLPEMSGDKPQWVNWEPSLFLNCARCLSTEVKPEYDITYHMTAATVYGCTDSGRITIHTEAGTRLNIPNVFSPNGDGRNDIFYVTGRRELILVKHFSVYNRNGERLIDRAEVPPNDPAYGWDGNYHGLRAPAGGYLYFVTVAFSDGSEEQRRGTVLLLR